jgi:hypothetical protein
MASPNTSAIRISLERSGESSMPASQTPNMERGVISPRMTTSICPK